MMSSRSSTSERRHRISAQRNMLGCALCRLANTCRCNVRNVRFRQINMRQINIRSESFHPFSIQYLIMTRLSSVNRRTESSNAREQS